MIKKIELFVFVASEKVKLGDIWDSGVVAICIWGTFDRLAFIVIVGSFDALVWSFDALKWFVTGNGLPWSKIG